MLKKKHIIHWGIQKDSSKIQVKSLFTEYKGMEGVQGKMAQQYQHLPHWPDHLSSNPCTWVEVKRKDKLYKVVLILKWHFKYILNNILAYII